jgi:hypothetical protein
VAARLPGLDSDGVAALALVELARVERSQAARELGLDTDAMGSALAHARKELRRSRGALAGSGWCERAERLISDRLDGDLAAFSAKRLDAHLRNCPRCVGHELQLVQAIDELVEGMPGKPAAAVRLVPPKTRALPPGEPERELEAGPEEPALEAAPEEPALESAPEEPALESAPEEPALESAPEEPALEAAPEPEALPPEGRALAPAPEEPALGPAPPSAPGKQRGRPVRQPARSAPAPGPPASAPPAPASGKAPVALPPRPLVDPRPVSALVAAFTWHIAFALAVLLAIATIAITVIGIGGGRI